MSQKKEWTRKEVESLIAAYHTHGCLWNWLHPEYRDKPKRKKALTSLSQQFNTDETEICRKLHNLRNQFGSELKKSKTKKKYDDEPYESRWPYFQQLKFIQPTLETGARYSSGAASRDGSAVDHWSHESSADGSDGGRVLGIKVEESASSGCGSEGRDRVKRSTGDFDDIDNFGLFVANEIRSLSSEALRKKLKRKIQRSILEVAEEDEL